MVVCYFENFSERRSVILVFALPILAGITTLVLIGIFTPLAPRFSLLDDPDHRKLHVKPVPMVGGVSIYLATLSTMVIINPPENMIWLMVSAGILVAVGALDDAIGLSVRIRFASQIFASAVMVGGGSIWIQTLGVNLYFLGSMLEWLWIPFTIFAVVGLTNGFNMSDGIDGLASGYAFVGLASVYLTLYFTLGSVHQAEWLILLISVIFAFWLVNMSLVPMRQVFLGDAGSLFLGFVMSWTLIYYTQQPEALMHPVAALWSVSIPVFDTLIVIVSRIRSKSSPFSSDRNHLHYLLVDAGVSPRIALVILLCLAIMLNSLGIWITYAVSPLFSLIVYGVLLAAFGYGTLRLGARIFLAFKSQTIN